MASRTVRPRVDGERRPTGTDADVTDLPGALRVREDTRAVSGEFHHETGIGTDSSGGHDVPGIGRESLHGTVAAMVRAKSVNL